MKLAVVLMILVTYRRSSGTCVPLVAQATKVKSLFCTFLTVRACPNTRMKH